MRRFLFVLLALAGAAPALANTGFEPVSQPPALAATSLLVPPAAFASGGSISAFGNEGRAPKKGKKRSAPRPATPDGMPLGPERARILLRSLTVPGWGQATLGRRHSAAAFAVLETGIWTAFTSFRVQEQLRRRSYERTAQLFAGIDLNGRDEEYRRIVGAFPSSDDYNLYVVARDAANIYLTDPTHPDMDGYRAYIAAHSLSGSDAWHWTDRSSYDRYSAQRRFAQHAAINANTALALAIANRLLSALHAAHAAGHTPAGITPSRTGWNFDVSPGSPSEPILVRAALTTRF